MNKLVIKLHSKRVNMLVIKLHSKRVEIFEEAPNVHVGLVNFLVTLIPQGDEEAPNVHVGLVNF